MPKVWSQQAKIQVKGVCVRETEREGSFIDVWIHVFKEDEFLCDKQKEKLPGCFKYEGKYTFWLQDTFLLAYEYKI